MATIQDVFSHIYTTEAHLSEVPVKNGQIVLCVDSEKLYIDHGSTRVGISDVVQVETQDALPLAPLDKFYITQDTGDVYFYINDAWKKLTDTIRDYTAFEVYANDAVISPGEHEVLGTITVEIPVQMTETFALRTTTAEADSDVVVDWGDGTIQKVKDGEHGGYTGPDGEGRYIAKMTHTYGTAGKYTVKVYGQDYFCLSHAPSHVADASNMQCRILADDLPIASHLTNLTAFAYGTLKLVTVQCASYKYLHRTTNHAQMFTNDKNLLSVTGFEDLVMISRGAEGCFQFCENMHTCDFNGVLCSNNPRAMYAMYQNCYALAINIGTFFPTKFVSRALNFTNTFTHMHAMTGTVNAKQLWGDPTIDWQGYSNCFYGCPDEIRAQVPTAWGGTASDPVAYELTVDSITLNGHAANTASGLVILNAQGKVDNTLLPDTSIDLSNYSQNGTIKLTSTAGAVDLISNTMEVALYSGTAHVKANVDSVELQGTNLKFNNNVQNTAGGIVVVDKETGKIPADLYNNTVDLSDYTALRIKLTTTAQEENAFQIRDESGDGVSIGSDGFNYTYGSNLFHLGEHCEITCGTTPDLRLNGAQLNSPNGLVQLNAEGKIPTSLYEQAEGGLTSVTTGAGLSGNGTSSSPLVLNLADYMSTSAINMESTNSITLTYGSRSISLSSSGIGLNVLSTADLKLNGVSPNAANGLVVLNDSGKIPANLYDVTIDLTNYSISEEIHLTSNQKVSLAGMGCSIDCGNDSIYMQGGTATVTTIATEKFYVTSSSEFDGSVVFGGSVILSTGTGHHELNTAEGLVQLGTDGKVPSSLLPEMSQSWTKVTINQSSFATSDDTYGGSYYELTGICSVEVYDADGYKVEFDVKCDFTNNKTRVYIPSGLAADTISNWTLLYLAKTIA